MKHRCANCGHQVKTNREMGSVLKPDKLYHWVEGWGSKCCVYCSCDKAEKEEWNVS